MLNWSEKFETGHPEIDAQHKLLITYINGLAGMCHTTNPDRRQIEFFLNFVDFLEQYTSAHFQLEERCMESHRCPAHQKNKSAHGEFLLMFKDFKRRVEVEGWRADLLEQFHQRCQSWIETHILQLDLQIKPCLARR
jgi:hemerythrin